MSDPNPTYPATKAEQVATFIAAWVENLPAMRGEYARHELADVPGFSLLLTKNGILAIECHDLQPSQ